MLTPKRAPMLIEAAARTGQPALASVALDRLTDTAAALGADWHLASRRAVDPAAVEPGAEGRAARRGGQTHR